MTVMTWHERLDPHEIKPLVEAYKQRKITSKELCEKWGASRPAVVRRWINTEYIPNLMPADRAKTLTRHKPAPTPRKRRAVAPPSASFYQPPRPMLKSAVFDIETTDLTADGVEGMLICAAILPLDADEAVIHRLQWGEGDDRRLVTRVRAALDHYDILIGHNIRRHDINFIRTRADYWDLQHRRKNFLEFDTLNAAQGAGLLLNSKSLSALADFYGVATHRTVVQRSTWSQVRSTYEPEFEHAMSVIVDHCVGDVRDNRSLFWHLYPTAMRDGKKSPFTISARPW